MLWPLILFVDVAVCVAIDAVAVNVAKAYCGHQCDVVMVVGCVNVLSIACFHGDPTAATTAGTNT